MIDDIQTLMCFGIMEIEIASPYHALYLGRHPFMYIPFHRLYS